MTNAYSPGSICLNHDHSVVGCVVWGGHKQELIRDCSQRLPETAQRCWSQGRDLVSMLAFTIIYWHITVRAKTQHCQLWFCKGSMTRQHQEQKEHEGSPNAPETSTLRKLGRGVSELLVDTHGPVPVLS